jgi:hypothetical protein
MEERAMKELDYGISVAAGALIEAMGMQAENLQRVHGDERLAYLEKDFCNLAERRGLHHDAVLTRWQDIF